MGTFHNCHTHVFTSQAVPNNFLPLGLLRFLAKHRLTKKLGRFLNKIIPSTDNDIFDRFASFMNIGSRKSSLEIFKFLKGFYPEGTKFVVLSMDMAYMKAGKVLQDFLIQLDELAEIKTNYPEQCYPFICVDPRRPNITNIVKTYIEQKKFQGIKLYPPLGYYPFDQRLYPVYEYAEANKIPIITHCCSAVVFYRGKITPDMLVHPKSGKKLTRKDKKNFADYYTHPKNYEYVLNDFPELKICLAHFGGGREWKSYLSTPWEKGNEDCWFSIILDLIKKHLNVYADISYVLSDIKLFPLLKVILQDPNTRPKILYGSDFYMVELDRSERSFSINVRANLGEEDYSQVAITNPDRFFSRY